jgi:hypothetical protein
MSCNSIQVWPYRKALATATTNTTFSAKIPTATKPAASTTRAVIDLYDASLGIATSPRVPKYVFLQPYATAADNVTLDMRLWGWNKTADIATNLWVPTLIAQLALIVGNIDGSAIEASALMADTLTATYGYGTSIVTAINSPAGTTNLTGGFLTHILGSELLEFDFDVGTATAANCLWRMVDEQ